MSRTLQKDLMLEIAAGNVPGKSSVNKFGSNTDIALDTREDIWDVGGDYPFPTTADITHISQAVDQVAMRGGTILVKGLDVSWAENSQTKDLDATNTTTAVALDTALIRVFTMQVQEDVVTDQNIDIHNIGDTITYGRIPSGDNQTNMAIYTVPSGKTAYMTKYYATLTQGSGKEPKGASVQLWTADRDNGYEFKCKSTRGIQKGGSLPERDFEPYFKIPTKNDIKITGVPFEQAGIISAGFDLILEDD